MEIIGSGDLTAGKKIIAENFANWTSGNEIIDNFIQEKQLNYDASYTKYGDIKAVFEWIPYNELIGIKELGKSCFATAIWKEGPLFHCERENEWMKKSYEFVTLKFLYDLQNITDEFINKVKSKSGVIFGISQNPDTEVYLLVICDKYFDHYCKCELEHYTSAIWKKGPLYYTDDKKLVRKSYEKVYLKYLYNSQEITDEFSNEVESYLKNNEIFGISQNPDTEVYILVFHKKYLIYYCGKCGNKYDDIKYKWCKQCEINQLKDNFTNWTSGNIKFDDLIQKMQLKINKSDTVFEWIPYNEIIITEELEHYTSAIWKKGPLYYTDDKKLVRKSYEKVYLKYLYNSQEITDEFSNEVESYLKNNEIFGISQNPDTKVYILVFYNKYLIYYCEKCGNKYDDIKCKWCKQCEINQLKNNFTNWTSGNIKFDDFIQKMQLKINKYSDTVFEWIPYNEIIIIAELEHYTSAIWKKGITDEFSNEVESYLKSGVIFGISQNPDTKVHILVFYNEYLICYCEKCELENYSLAIWEKDNTNDQKSVGKSREKVYLKYLYNSQEITADFSNEVESYLENKVIFGISQNPDTEVYLLVFNVEYFDRYCEKCGNEYDDINHLSLSEVIYSVKENYGITQNPNTKDYMLVCKIEYYCEICGKKYNNQFERNNKSCISCQTNHENKKIHDLIQEIKLNIDHNSGDFDIMFEWIPYDQFNDIKEIGKGGFSTVYSAIWKDGVLFYDCNPFKTGWKRQSNTKVALKCLNNSQNFLDEFVNEVKAYTNQKIDNILKIYGISQNPNTKEYIMVLEYAEGGNFINYLKEKYQINKEIEKQFNETQEYRKENFLSIKNNQLTTHTQAIYTSRLLNPFTKNLPKYEDNFNSNTVEITDFTNL
ncbi:uncharacterized protein OCT59_029178 [Rhizophagus irregularis]|uniref:uncharacterized protein n=1 Tax=Rhizophagus irregularis TaxID=588596 RepID=UPI0033282D2B|nr:hypothetical protein OCT59_029178 [Rhizophagus irregularis]